MLVFHSKELVAPHPLAKPEDDHCWLS